ncbi:MAG: glycerate kinase [Bacteroidales bacterium]|nr:glycerate kinase [Bacteroidales bacterium]
MSRKIVIASDSFKGSLSSHQVSEAAEKGIRTVLPDCEVISINIADGGEGTAEAIAEATSHTTHCINALVHDPLGRHIEAEYQMTSDGTALMEMAAASGLTLLSPAERDPLLTSSFGTGEMILDAIDRGCRNFIIGIGGSSTNDGGTGMLEALGFRFLDTTGNQIKGLCGRTLESIDDIDVSEVPTAVLESSFTIACDVETPFCGKEGATYVFAPQKGADAKGMEILESGMRSLNEVIRKKTGTDLSKTKGAGAAGGLGGAFKACLNASLTKGIDLILDMAGFDEMAKDADLIITGEGRIDHQTCKGKTISGIVSRAKKAGIPVIAIAGIVDLDENEMAESGLAGALPIGPRPENESDLEYAMRPEVASSRIKSTVAKALVSLSPSLFRGNP